jgi:hypothetical protein
MADIVLRQPEFPLRGGAGGLFGHVDEWPIIAYWGEGLCGGTRMISNPSIEAYQDLILELGHHIDEGC